jgi:hypothetical protein
MDFGRCMIGTRSLRYLTLRNLGNALLPILSCHLEDSVAFRRGGQRSDANPTGAITTTGTSGGTRIGSAANRRVGTAGTSRSQNQQQLVRRVGVDGKITMVPASAVGVGGTKPGFDRRTSQLSQNGRPLPHTLTTMEEEKDGDTTTTSGPHWPIGRFVIAPGNLL